jgi:cytochrome d ubiquinol oxidase subunit II
MAPELIVLGVILAGLTLYALLGGADFGAGVWEFNTVLQAPEKERTLIYRAIGPVWEANHVWLIFVLVGLHTAFPPAFAAVGRALWLPLLLGLVGIVFRGVGFAFRSYAAGAVRQQAWWGAVFAFASTAAPFFLGAACGAIASGHLAVTVSGEYTGDYVTGWLSPLSIFTAFFAVGVCAYLAAVYLTREASQEDDPTLTVIWRRRALASGAWMGILAMAGLAMVATDAPVLWAGFRERAWPLVGLSIVGGLCSLWALLRRHFTAAVLGAGVAVAAVIWGWGVAQYPAIIPPALTIAAARGPDTVLRAMLWSIVAGTVLLLPSLVYLFVLFKGKRPKAGKGLAD